MIAGRLDFHLGAICLRGSNMVAKKETSARTDVGNWEDHPSEVHINLNLGSRSYTKYSCDKIRRCTKTGGSGKLRAHVAERKKERTHLWRGFRAR